MTQIAISMCVRVSVSLVKFCDEYKKKKITPKTVREGMGYNEIQM